MSIRVKFLSILLLLTITTVSGCSKESNPAVPPAPEGDVVSVLERNPMMKIGLLSFTPQKNLYVSITRGKYNVYSGESVQEFAEGYSGDIMKFTGDEETIKFTDAGSEEAKELDVTLVRIEPDDRSENSYIEIGPGRKSLRPYRGTFRFILEGKNILAVNEVQLEEYLYGVVPAEMDPSWPEEALKAQAVASRTYALFQKDRYKNRGFFIADDERSQEYGGVAVETDRTTNIVVDTMHEVVTFQDRLACVVFHVESGGKTAGNLAVWPNSGDIPYLSSVQDKLEYVDYSEGGNYREWSSRIGIEELRVALNSDGETFAGEYLSSISILGISEDGRVQAIDIDGEKNPVVPVMAFIDAVNHRLGEDFLPSNRFDLHMESGEYVFSGTGKGHGVGMSQWGAYKRALNDQDYKTILETYYPGCEIKQIPDEGIEVVHNIHIDTIS